MKKLKITGVVLAAVMLMLTLAACGGTEKVTVTFDYNYAGAPPAYTQEIESGDVATPPTDPSREDHAFKGWTKAAGGGSAFDPEIGHTQDTTYYAQWNLTAVLVTFDWNYSGSSGTSQKVTVGGTAAQPTTDPTRDGYLFVGWYSDSGCTAQYEFSTVINEAKTIYAGWEELSGDVCSVVFSNNYGNAGNYYATTVNNGRRVARPADPTRDGYAFINWYTDADCTAEYNFNAYVTSNTTLYALWYDVYTFEAEYTYLDDVSGAGYSVDVTGKEVIVKDSGGIANASNGYYISSLYKYGIVIEFKLTATEAVENAQLVLRLSAEVMDMTIKSNKFLVQVNGENLTYPDMSFTNLPEPPTTEVRPFDNWIITKSLSLNKGDNTVKLIVDNNDALFGTMYATAPMIDCMYIYSPVKVEWKEYYPDNIAGQKS